MAANGHDVSRKRHQRQYIYSKLFDILKDYYLVLPINQIGSYCHGYAEVWFNNLDEWFEKYNGIDWQDEIKRENYNISFEPVSTDVEKNQFKSLVCEVEGKKYKKKFKSAIYCSKKREYNLIDVLFGEILINNEMSKNTIYIIEVASTASFKYIPKGKTFYKYKPNKIKKWHEMRIYIDKDNFVHWFDANIGWFKSYDKFDGIKLQNLLQQLFDILQYDIQYNVIAVTAILCVNKKIRLGY